MPRPFGAQHRATTIDFHQIHASFVRRKTTMTIKTIALLLCSGLIASAGRIDSMTLHDVRLKNLPLKEGERISAVMVNVASVYVRTVTLPLDWRAEVSLPDMVEGTTVWAEAGHGASWLNSGEDFGVLLTVASEKEWTGHGCGDQASDIKAWIVVEDSSDTPPRTNSVPDTCIDVNSAVGE